MPRKTISGEKNPVREESGQAVVEFALLLPLLLIFLMGILDFGWIFMNQYRVEQAAASAARYGAIHESRYASLDTRSAFLQSVSGKAVENLPDGADGDVLCVDTSRGAESGAPSEHSTLVCIKVTSAGVSVTVSYPVRTLTFVAGALYGRYYRAASTCVMSC